VIRSSERGLFTAGAELTVVEVGLGSGAEGCDGLPFGREGLHMGA